MPAAPVGQGIELSYTDSGPVAGSSNYTTLILLHGMTFNSAIFKKLFPLGVKHNVRVVTVVRRGYVGSTPYTDEEIADLSAGKAEFWERAAVEYATFLTRFAETQSIPAVSSDRKSGGLAVLGWSMGVAVTLSLLAYPKVLSQELQTKLGQYLRRLIIFDSPHYCFGKVLPEGGYVPVGDPELKTVDEITRAFDVWVTSYWDHPDIASRSLSGLSRNNKVARDPSVDSMTPVERSETMEPLSGLRSDLPLIFPQTRVVLEVQAQHALWDQELARTFLPNLQLAFLVCTSSPWDAVWNFLSTEMEYKAQTSRGLKMRPIHFIKVPGGNHVVQWDKPTLLFSSILEAIF